MRVFLFRRPALERRPQALGKDFFVRIEHVAGAAFRPGVATFDQLHDRDRRYGADGDQILRAASTPSTMAPSRSMPLFLHARL